MRFLAVWILLCLLVGVPFASRPLTELTPVEILCLQKQGQDVLARCDGGVAARGSTVQQAVGNLHRAAPGRLELGTVDFAVLTGVSPAELGQLGLRPAVGVFAAPAVEDPEALAVYLRTHGESVTLGMLEEDPSLPLPRLVPGETGLVLE